METTNINTNRIFIAICYFAPTNSRFYKKNNLDKTCPYNGLEHDISSLINEGKEQFR